MIITLHLFNLEISLYGCGVLVDMDILVFMLAMVKLQGIIE